MTDAAPSFVLGYHGCERAFGMKALATPDLTFIESDKDYDWLGPGIYFWENDPVRALEWAQWRATDPFVIGAVIDLGNCLDLTQRENITLLEKAFEKLCAVKEVAGEPLPENGKGFKGDADLVKRFLDCAVIRQLHDDADKDPTTRYDTVRGVFQEGGPAFPGSAIKSKTHIQIAVRTHSRIKGIFLPRDRDWM